MRIKKLNHETAEHAETVPANELMLSGGSEGLAEAIHSVARRHKVPIREDQALADTLSTLDVGAYIPPEMYRAVAEVIGWVCRVEGGVKK